MEIRETWPSTVLDRMGVDSPLSSNLVADSLRSGVNDLDLCLVAADSIALVSDGDDSGDRNCFDVGVDVVE
jgi:hypothetical protein